MDAFTEVVDPTGCAEADAPARPSSRTGEPLSASSRSQVDELIEAIYHGPLEAVPWRSFLQTLRKALDASGTTEALRFAEGLWEGARVFGEPADRELALLVLRAYRRHEYVDQGIWLIRNYFNLQTRAFATNSR